MECLFSIDKNKSLDIIRSIQNTTPSTAYYHNEYFCGCDCDECVSCYRHKLAFVELGLEELGYDEFGKDDIDISNFYDKVIKGSYDSKHYNRSETIDIKNIEIIDNDKIELDTYLRGTDVECDWSYPRFSYEEKIKTWIIRDDFWGAKNGIDSNGNVYILDFNGYKE